MDLLGFLLCELDGIKLPVGLSFASGFDAEDLTASGLTLEQIRAVHEKAREFKQLQQQDDFSLALRLQEEELVSANSEPLLGAPDKKLAYRLMLDDLARENAVAQSHHFASKVRIETLLSPSPDSSLNWRTCKLGRCATRMAETAAGEAGSGPGRGAAGSNPDCRIVFRR